MPQDAQIRLTIGGRVFIQESPTFEQDLYIAEQAADAGLMAMDGSLKLDPATDNLTLTARNMVIKAYKSGALFRLMAAMLTEEGTEWSPESAAINAEFFKTIRDYDSKVALQTGLAGAVVAFFENAASSDAISRTSLDAVSGTLGGNGSTSPRRQYSPEELEAVFSSGRMPTPSAKSPSTTKPMSGRSSRGKSGKGSSRTK